MFAPWLTLVLLSTATPVAPVAPAAPVATVAPAALWAAGTSSWSNATDDRPRVMFLDGPEVPWDLLVQSEFLGTRRASEGVHSDTLFQVGPGTSFVLSNPSGDIAVDTWDRNAVRVRTAHGRRDYVVARLRNGELRVAISNRRRAPTVADWRITVPTWMPLRLAGVEGEIDVAGLKAQLSAESFHGDVRVRTCSGGLVVRSVEGEVHVTDAEGNVSVGSVNNLILLERIKGPIEAQTINGDIQLQAITSVNVEASTVNGRVVYSSPFQPRGRYQLASHNGSLLVGVAEGSPLDVSVSPFQGTFESSIPMPPTPPSPASPATPGAYARAPRAPRAPRSSLPFAKSFRFALGAPGSASPSTPQLELESYQGLIRLIDLDKVRALADSARQEAMHERAELVRERAQLERERMQLERRIVRRHEAKPVKRAPVPDRDDEDDEH